MTLYSEDAVFYQGIPRWDFGLDNPNKAAAILACLLVVLLGLSLKSVKTGQTCFDTFRRWCRWCCGVFAAAVGLALVHTFSRGGLVAFFVGVFILLAGSWKGTNRIRRWLPLLLVTFIMIETAVWMGFAGRMANSFPTDDASVGNRLMIWRSVPAMIVDAPCGWGCGNAGDAYMGWYQPLDRHERYRTLVNSHFTWLVERGWTGRLCYVIGFALLFALGLVRLKARGDPIPLAVWACFATAAFFSSVAEEWYTWVIPAALAVPLLRTFSFNATMRTRCVSVAASLFSGSLLLGTVAMIGYSYRPADVLPLRKLSDGRLVVGEGEPVAWAVCDPATMGGPAFGRLLRGFAQTSEGRGKTYGLVDDLAAVPDDVHHLVLCGRAADFDANALARFPTLTDVRVLAPSTREHTDKWLAARAKLPCIRVICGEFSEACPEEDVAGLSAVLGAQDYLPDWPRLAFGP